MSTKKAEALHFNFSYEVLVSLSIEKEAFLRRDQAELASRGITLSRLDAFALLRDVFLEVPSETTQTQTQTKATNDRDNKAEELRLVVKDVLSIANISLGKNSYAYKSFNIQKLSTLSAGGLYALSENVILQCATYNAKMTAKGLTPETVTKIGTLRTDLLPLIKGAPVAVGQGKAITGIRHDAANALFDEMVAMCLVGRTYYQDRNPLKASEYVIYDKAAKMVERKGTVLPGQTLAPKAKGLQGNSPIEIKVATGKSLVFYFGWAKGSKIGTKGVTVYTNPNIYSRFTAADLGFDEETGTMTLNIYNPNPDASDFVVKLG